MKKILITIAISLALGLMFSSCKQAPDPVTPTENNSQSGTTKTDKTESTEGYLDLRNVLVSNSSRSVYRDLSFIGDENYVVTKPVSTETGWDVNQAPTLFTQDVIDSLFKFEPATDGIKITYTRPDSFASNNQIQGVFLNLLDKNNNIIVKQEVTTEILNNQNGYSWVFPFVDPNNTSEKDGKINIALQTWVDGKQLNKVYQVYCGGGLGRPEDLKSDLKPYSTLSNKKHTLQNIFLPDEENLTLVYEINALAVNDSEKPYPVDENSKNLWKNIGKKDVSISESDRKSKHLFEFPLEIIKSYADKNDYPYFYVVVNMNYTKPGYVGTFHGPSLYSNILSNDYYSIPTHKRYNCSLKEAYYTENGDNAFFDLAALNTDEYKNKFICFDITLNTPFSWSALFVNWANQFFTFNSPAETFTRKYGFKIADLIKMQDDAESENPNLNHSYDLDFCYFLKDNNFSIGDITLEDEVTITLVANGGSLSNSNPIKAGKNCYLEDSIPTPEYAGKFFTGWYTDSALTQKLNNGVAQDTTLYAKYSDTIDIISTSYVHPDSGDTLVNYTNYLSSYSDKYICFTINNKTTDYVWGAVTVDYHNDDTLVDLGSSSKGIKTYAVKISDLAVIENKNLSAGQESGKDPHWNYDKLCFQGLGEDSYNLTELYIANTIPEGAVVCTVTTK